ncbi:AtpZ/AtpI family protein [Sorangium sp. So ce1014]|uniref:AtpZ/AtpI family protein n=1 Tax=Sorangium sp. So ce1014 TaxID=3133326 RepID=UPI003F63FB5D
MKQDWKAVGSYGTVGLEVVLCIMLGLFVGRWLDAKLGTDPFLSVLWFFFGLGAAGKAVHRAWKEMQIAAAREEREQGNPAPMFDDRKARQDERADGDRRADSIDVVPYPDERPPAKEHDER